MKASRIVLTLALVLISMAAAAQKSFDMKLWNGAMPDDNGDDKDIPMLKVFLPAADKATGRAVVICPGGGYEHLCMDYEGTEWAPFFNDMGIAAIVLKYRMPHGVTSVPASDAEQAMRTVRANAKAWHVNVADVGIMGFSAGGHLAMLTAEMLERKPAFVASIYPVVTMHKPYVHKRSRRALLGEYGKRRSIMRDSLSLERHVTPDCPPVFLVNCKDDPVVKYQNAELLDSALTANGIPHRYIQYNTGGHGFGASDTKGTEECRQWRGEFLAWLKETLERKTAPSSSSATTSGR